MCGVLFFQAEDGIRDLVRSRGLGDVYKRQVLGLSVIIGRVGAGMLLDRFWAPGICAAVFLLPIVGFNMLYIDQPAVWQLALAVALCGLSLIHI